MTNQPQLSFESPAPRVTSAEVAVLIAVLSGQGWVTAKQLWASWTDRQLRALASASEGRIVSGQRGYALIEAVTVEEANHAAAWLRHQGTKMIQRAYEIEQAMHRRTA